MAKAGRRLTVEGSTLGVARALTRNGKRYGEDYLLDDIPELRPERIAAQLETAGHGSPVHPYFRLLRIVTEVVRGVYRAQEVA